MKEKILNLIVDVENGIISRLKCASIIDSLINQEVEKRIAGRMPSEAEKRAKARHLFVDGLNVLFACEEYDKWLHSRLVSQKTEGGGE